MAFNRAWAAVMPVAYRKREPVIGIRFICRCTEDEQISTIFDKIFDPW
jgi:hypothetical protein